MSKRTITDVVIETYYLVLLKQPSRSRWARRVALMIESMPSDPIFFMQLLWRR